MAAYNNAVMQLLEKIETFFPDSENNPTLQDLKNPTSSMVYKFLGRVLMEFNIAFEDLRMTQYDQSLCSKYPENYGEIIPYINVYEIFQRIFQISDINVNFSMKDIIQPKPNQIVRVMNAIMDFLIYADQKVADLQPIFDKINQEKQEFQNQKDKIRIFKEKINELLNENALMDKKKGELLEEQENLARNLKAKEAKTKELENLKKAMVAKYKATESTLEKTTRKKKELQEERDKKNSLIVYSPLKIKSDIESLRRKRIEKRKELDDMKNKIEEYEEQNKQLARVLEMLEEWSSKMGRAQELVITAGDLEAKLKECQLALEAREKSYKELERKYLNNEKKLEMAEAKEKKMCDTYEIQWESIKLNEKTKKNCLESLLKDLEESKKLHSSLKANTEEYEKELKVETIRFNSMMQMLHDKCEEIIGEKKKFMSEFAMDRENRLSELKKMSQTCKMYTPGKENKPNKDGKK